MGEFWLISFVVLFFLVLFTYDEFELFITLFIMWLFVSIAISGAIWDSNKPDPDPKIKQTTFEVTK